MPKRLISKGHFGKGMHFHASALSLSQSFWGILATPVYKVDPKKAVTKTVYVMNHQIAHLFSLSIEPFWGLYHVNCLCNSFFGPFMGP